VGDVETEASTLTRRYVCSGCGAGYSTKKQVERCEGRHRLFTLWGEGKVDDLAVAEGLGLPTDTPEAKKTSLRSVRNMLMKGADSSLSVETLRGVSMRVAPPIFMAVTKIHGDGRVQVPAEIRGIWGAADGDFVFWYRQGDTILLTPSHSEAQHRKPHYTYTGEEQPAPP